jgi:SsrA-binding protein
MEVLRRNVSNEYDFEYQIEAGISLTGYEVKAIRNSSLSINEAYCFIHKSEVFIKNLNLQNSTRDKKLLLHKREIKRMIGIYSRTSFVIIPIKFYEKRGKFKLFIGIGKKTTEYDKRQKIKKKENERKILQHYRI